MNNLTDKEKWDLINKAFHDGKELSDEEGKLIVKYNTAMQLQTLVQAKSKYSNDMSLNLKRKITEWENSIARYLEKYIKEEGRHE